MTSPRACRTAFQLSKTKPKSYTLAAGHPGLGLKSNPSPEPERSRSLHSVKAALRVAFGQP